MKQEKINRLLGDAFKVGGNRLALSVRVLLDKGHSLPTDESNVRNCKGIGSKSVLDLLKHGFLTERYAGLSTKARNCLRNAHIENRDQTRKAIEQNRLNPDKKGCNGFNKNYGWKTHKEVCAWAGLPEPQKPKRVQICPHCGRNVLSV